MTLADWKDSPAFVNARARPLIEAQTVADANDAADYDLNRSRVFEHIARQLFRTGAALRAAGFDPRARGFRPISDESYDAASRFITLDKHIPNAVYTHHHRQAALKAVCLDSDEVLNTRQELLRAAIMEGTPHQPEIVGPWMDDSQVEDPDGVLNQPAGAALSYFTAQDALGQLIASEGGRVIEAKVAAESLAAFRLNCDYTVRLADALEKTGWKVKFADVGEANPEGRKVRPSVTFIPLGQPDNAVTIPNVQRLNFFPVVAAGRRAPIQRALAYILQRNPFACMATITSGPRNRPDANLENLRKGSTAFHWRLGELFRHRFFTRHADPLLRGTEYGTPKASAAAWKLLNGMPAVAGGYKWTMHIHGHVIYTPKKRHDGRIWSRQQWARFRTWIRLRLAALARLQDARETSPRLKWRDFRKTDRRAYTEARQLANLFGLDCPQAEHHAELGERIRNAAEAVKYPVKPADLEEMLEHGGPEAIRLFAEQTKGLNLIQPMGELRDLRRRLAVRGERIVRTTTPEGGILVIRPDWNRPSPANNNERDFMGERGRAARLAKLARAMRPDACARFKRKLNRKTAAAARALLDGIATKTERVTRTLANIETARARADYWQSKASAWELENRVSALARAEEHAARHVENLERLTNELNEAKESKKRLERELVHLLETFPHALHSADIGALPAGVIEMMQRMTARCTLPEHETAAPRPADDQDAAARPPVRNRLLAITAPCALAGTRVTQPFAVVVGYNGTFTCNKTRQGLADQTRRVREVADATAAQITTALRLADELDATKPQRAARRPLLGSHYPPNSPGGQNPESSPQPAEGWFPALANELFGQIEAVKA